MFKRKNTQGLSESFPPASAIIFFLLFCFFLLPSLKGFPIFISVETVEDARIKRIVISPLDENLIYAGSDNSLFKSSDCGLNFKKICVFKDEKLNDIV
jgi:hypothetical protein